MAGRISTLLFACFSLICFPAAGQQQTTSAQASIDGKTMSIDGQPLRKVNLTLRPLMVMPPGGRGAAGSFQPPTPYAATSDAGGKFSFTGLEAGRYTLMAERAGYMNTTYGTKRTTGGAMTGNSLITLTAGQHMTGVDLELSPQATISGKVTDEDGDPMPRVQVSALRRMYGGGASRLSSNSFATTDDNGDFHLTNLQTGKYYISVAAGRMGPMQQAVRRTGVEANAPETAYSTMYFPGAPDIETATQVDAVEGQDTAGTNLRMRKVPVYHVRGTFGGDLPAPDPSMPAFAAGRLVQVRVIPAGGVTLGGGILNMQPTNADGTFDTGGLPPGTYTVSLVRAQGQLQTLGQTTVVISNGDVNGVALIARRPVDVTGTVRIVPEGATVMRAAGQGQMALGGILGGQGQNLGQEGQASSRQPAPLARVQQVSLETSEGFGNGVNVQPAQVQADGSFTLKNVPPLKLRVFAPPPVGGYLKSATFNGQDALKDGVDMSSGGKIDIVVSMTAARIDGKVNNADGQAAGEATIVIGPDPAQPGRRDLYRQSRSREDGSYTMPPIAPGKYRAYAFEEMTEPGAFLDPDYMKPFESLGTSITVEDNDKKTVELTQISRAKAQEILRQAGR